MRTTSWCLLSRSINLPCKESRVDLSTVNKILSIEDFCGGSMVQILTSLAAENSRELCHFSIRISEAEELIAKMMINFSWWVTVGSFVCDSCLLKLDYTTSCDLPTPANCFYLIAVEWILWSDWRVCSQYLRKNNSTFSSRGAVATKIICVAIFTSSKLNSYVIIDYFDSIFSLFTRYRQVVLLAGARNICDRIWIIHRSNYQLEVCWNK